MLTSSLIISYCYRPSSLFYCFLPHIEVDSVLKESRDKASAK